MVPSVQLAKLADARPLASLYDLVLTFDYENLNTTIEENGRLLKERLEAAGLGSGHGKTLDIAAHSMGGLVSRWFIEREGGNQVVRRLVMLGTPNGGSPWPKVVDWATVALGARAQSPHSHRLARFRRERPRGVDGESHRRSQRNALHLQGPDRFEAKPRPRHPLRHARRQHVDHPGGDCGRGLWKAERLRTIALAAELAGSPPQGCQPVLP